jgi:N-acetylglucosamine-6-sulfatase
MRLPTKSARITAGGTRGRRVGILLAVLLVFGVGAHLSGRTSSAQTALETPTTTPMLTLTGTPGPATPARPNIIMLMTDDETVTDMAVMPKVHELLAQQGVTFSNSFVSYPLCCPSRTTYLTGQYTHNNGVWANLPNREGFQQFTHQNTTFPVALQQAGYRTFHVGKYLNGYGKDDPTQIPPGWNEWHGTIDPTTYRYYRFKLNNDGVLRTYPAKPDYYSTDYFTQLATDFIQKQAGTGQPFFLNLAFLAPHSGQGATDIPGDHAPPPGKKQQYYCLSQGIRQEIVSATVPVTKECSREMIRRPVTDGYAVPAPRESVAFQNAPLPKSPSFNEQNVADKPSFFRTSGDYPLMTKSEIATVTQVYDDRLASLLAVDDAVEKIVTMLDQTHQLDNTVIIFTSDNGFFLGQHRIPFGKYWPYEEAIRVPLIIRGPGIPEGVVRSSPVVNIDLAPTILDFAHAAPLRRMDGRSLIPLMQNPSLHWQRDILLEGNTGNAVAYEGIRTSRYVYIEYRTGDRELYDLKKDPYELNSLQNDPRYQSVLVDLQTRLYALEHCSGSSCW